MLRLACFLLIAATMIGALMPSSHKAAATVEEDGVVYTPQSSGSSYRVVGSGGSREAATRASTQSATGGAIRLQREGDGHFYAEAKVNGTPIRFLIDTGATSVALSKADAQRAGFALGPLNETVGNGASGAVHGQWVMIDSVELGGQTTSGIDAAVLAGGDTSLLGQSVLRQYSISVEGDEMVLR